MSWYNEEKKKADELRAQGVEIMKAKTQQSMERCEGVFSDDIWVVMKECLLGFMDGCDQVAKELRDGTLPEKFRK
ncbi:hypothetical protein [Leclercia sp.]|uniref:hypothetical protein n=1 Tax=Leclercia sp. TaxID=1898428 RepID=UPI0028AECC01|nr:hypothetical protein [Leclercia sp.]